MREAKKQPAAGPGNHPRPARARGAGTGALAQLQALADADPRTLPLRQLQALARRHSGAVVQRVQITKEGLGDTTWEKMADEFIVEDDATTLETATLDPDGRTNLVTVLRAEGHGVLATQIEQETQAPQDRTGAASIYSPDERREMEERKEATRAEQDEQARLYRERKRQEEWDAMVGPAYSKLNEIWNKDYHRAHRTFRGHPGEVRSDALDDPAVRLLFPNPETFLKLIGWGIMLQTSKDIPDDTVEIDLALFNTNQFNIHTSFPFGWQDTNFHYTSNDGGKTFTITVVHRHRSTKTEGAPANTFMGMIREQATGVQELGDHVRYDSDAIRDESSGGYGYNVWPKMGFDGEIPADRLQAMIQDTTPAEASGSTSSTGQPAPAYPLGIHWLQTQTPPIRFSQLFAQTDKVGEQLRALWRIHGDTVNVQFDQRKGSQSWTTLDAYEKSKKPK